MPRAALSGGRYQSRPVRGYYLRRPFNVIGWVQRKSTPYPTGIGLNKPQPTVDGLYCHENFQDQCCMLSRATRAHTYRTIRCNRSRNDRGQRANHHPYRGRLCGRLRTSHLAPLSFFGIAQDADGIFPTAAYPQSSCFLAYDLAFLAELKPPLCAVAGSALGTIPERRVSYCNC